MCVCVFEDEKLPVFVPPEVSILNEIFLKRAMSVCVCVFLSLRCFPQMQVKNSGFVDKSN